MSTQKTFVIIALLGASVLSFVFGYTYRANREQQTSIFRLENSNQPNITADILDEQIREALQPNTGTEAVYGPSELHVYTGYVRTISTTEIVVEKPDATTNWPDSITVTLTDDTTYSSLQQIIDNNLPTTVETDLSRKDITEDAIVSVYVNEDIYTADVLVATKVQLLTT